MGLQGGKPIHERSGRELILLFVIVPWIMGIGFLGMICFGLRDLGEHATWRDWLGIVWGVLLSFALMLGLPAAAWQEWQRRKRFRTSRNSSEYQAAERSRAD